MRKILAIVAILALLVGFASAGSMKWAVGLTGGGNALDGIASPSAGDTAMVFTDISSTTAAAITFYSAISGTTTESSPDIILPNTNTNSVTWYRVKTLYGMVSSPSGTNGIVTINSSGTSSLVSVGTMTNAFLGVDQDGVIDFYNDIIVSTNSITGTALFSAQTCSPRFVTGVTSTGALSCGTP